jgi:hypothetical protein
MVGKAKPSTRAKWRSSLSACRGVQKKGIDSAGVVREAIFHQLTSILISKPTIRPQSMWAMRKSL